MCHSDVCGIFVCVDNLKKIYECLYMDNKKQAILLYSVCVL